MSDGGISGKYFWRSADTQLRVEKVPGNPPLHVVEDEELAACPNRLRHVWQVAHVLAEAGQRLRRLAAPREQRARLAARLPPGGALQGLEAQRGVLSAGTERHAAVVGVVGSWGHTASACFATACAATTTEHRRPLHRHLRRSLPLRPHRRLRPCRRLRLHQRRSCLAPSHSPCPCCGLGRRRWPRRLRTPQARHRVAPLGLH